MESKRQLTLLKAWLPFFPEVRVCLRITTVRVGDQCLRAEGTSSGCVGCGEQPEEGNLFGCPGRGAHLRLNVVKYSGLGLRCRVD